MAPTPLLTGFMDMAVKYFQIGDLGMIISGLTWRRGIFSEYQFYIFDHLFRLNETNFKVWC